MQYIILLVVTALLAWANFDKPKVSKSFFLTYCLLIGIFVGIGDMLGGYDRYVYAEAFEAQAWSVHLGKGLFNADFLLLFKNEPVYGLLNSLVGYFTPNRYIFILFISLLIYVLLPLSLYKHTKYPFFSLLIFLGLMFFFSFTYLRQVLACGLCWMAIPFAVERKFWRFAIFVVAATLIHNSAAYFILLYFIPQKKYAPSKVVLVMSLLLVLGLTGITKSLFIVAGGITENAKISHYSVTAEHGFRIEYVIEAVLFLFILLKNYAKVQTDRRSLVLLNVYLMFCGVLLFFCRSSDGGRIAWFCSLGVRIMMSEFCCYRNTIGLRSFVTVLCVVLYLRIFFAWGVLLRPYKTFLSDGCRKGDFIYQDYEYDHNY
ncbi:MAG: EpsG family protein, partial [Alloprevotella tannerae]|nr:EpsG family protein [Alloprevotella tannerae]